MKPIRKFDEFLNEGIVKSQYPDKSRANFLITESEKTDNFLKNTIKIFGITDENANSIIKLSYDILMELIRAKMLIQGYNAIGQGAHEAEVSYLREMGFSENDVQFADQLRYFRNGMVYYGKILDKEYAEKVLEFLNRIASELKRKI
ncbi:MAG: hypothetical protein QW666_01950 [Candidatus Woesearchaeota archaeon]